MVYTIVIDGIIGCGKSSLITELNNDFTCFQEPVNEWSLLADFYTNQSKFSAPFQYQVLFSFHKLYSSIKNVQDKVVLERCPWSSKHIFTSMLIEEGHITPTEEFVYNSFYDKVAFKTNLFIYLKVDTNVAYQRILNRDRPAERGIKLSYLEKLNNKYEKEMITLKNVRIVDANKSIKEVKLDVINILKSIQN